MLFDFLQVRRFIRQVPGERANVLLLIDEFSSLHSAQPDVRDSFLFVRSRDSDGVYVIRSIIGVGNYSMTYLRSSNQLVSPFNSGNHIRNPNFTLEEVGQLFREFAKDRKIQIGNNIVSSSTNRYVR